MRTVIEFYDKDIIKNIMGVLALKPDRVVFLYDSELKDHHAFTSLENCFRVHIPNLIFETRSVDINNLNGMYTAAELVIRGSDESFVDLTGGSEMMIIAGYKTAAIPNNTVVHTDLIRGFVFDVETNAVIANLPKLSLSDFFNARGAVLSGNSHNAPQPEDFDIILDMGGHIFRNQKTWKELCSFIQTSMGKTLPYDLFLHGKNIFGKNIEQVEFLLDKFQENGFIKNLFISKNSISCEFTDTNAKAYLISFGVWLELYVYITAVRSGAFDDVALGMMIDWDMYDQLQINNEIDVVISDNSVPVFVSCKFTEANTAALNELVIAKKRLGGWFSKGVIVTFGEEKSKNMGTYQRAKSLGLELLDRSDVMSPYFQQKLVASIKEHDLVKLKWKKI